MNLYYSRNPAHDRRPTRLTVQFLCNLGAAWGNLGRALVALASLAGASRATAQTPTDLVTLPAFTVIETREGLPWKYGQVAGIEVLSVASEALTERVVTAVWRCRSVKAPASLLAQPAAPTLLVIYNQPPDEQAPAAVESVNSPKEAELWRIARASGLRGNIAFQDGDRAVLCLNLWDYDFQEPVLEGESQQLISGRTPPWPEWIWHGVIGPQGVYRRYSITPRDIVTPPLDWISRADSNLAIEKRQLMPGLLPWNDIFAKPQPRVIEGSTRERDRWRSQAGLFCRWATAEEKRAKSFWQFAQWSITEPVNEDAFQKFFGLTYAKLSAEINKFFPTALTEVNRRRFPRLETLDPKLRPATEAEVGRIKGHFEHSQGMALRKNFPEVSKRYLEAAGRTFKRALRFAPQDPDLQAVYGLYACDAGDEPRGEEALKVAVANKVVCPSAYIRLAALHYAAALQAPAGEPGKLSSDQIASILTPLFAIRQQEPHQAAVYSRIADVWARSATPPKWTHLAVLEEALKWFPRDTKLCQQIAEVYAQYGFRQPALNAIDHRLKLQLYDDESEQLSQLRERIAALP